MDDCSIGGGRGGGGGGLHPGRHPGARHLLLPRECLPDRDPAPGTQTGGWLRKLGNRFLFKTVFVFNRAGETRNDPQGINPTCKAIICYIALPAAWGCCSFAAWLPQSADWFSVCPPRPFQGAAPAWAGPLAGRESSV